MQQVRVRFAPSPTGYLHIGGARTALFNWLFAKKNNGRFILRIEDTDATRLKKDSVEQILRSLKWLGIDWDEGPAKEGAYGPYYQSERQSFYAGAATDLLNSGKAYYCFCSEEELETEREKQRQEGLPVGYSGKCRNLSAEEVEKKLQQGLKPVIRLKLPAAGQIIVQDLIRGSVRFEANQFDDFVIVKSNGTPAYNFACVVDDHAMQISHVIRAEEHLSNTPKQQLVYKAMGYEIPVFAHLSMILAPDRSKLSKRHGATSVSEFEELGCLPEAIVNYLTLLGWSPAAEQGEMMTPAETAKMFSLDKVSKTAAVYDVQKLIWLNGQYIMQYDPEKLTAAAKPFLIRGGLVSADEARESHDYIKSVVMAVRERVKTLQELPEACRYFFQEIDSYDEKGKAKYFNQENAEFLLEKGRECLAVIDDFTVENTETVYRNLMEKLNIKGGLIIHPTRLALTGRTASPGLFEVMALLGKEKCLKRLDQAIKFIKTEKDGN